MQCRTRAPGMRPMGGTEKVHAPVAIALQDVEIEHGSGARPAPVQTNAFVHILLFIAACVPAHRKVKLGKGGIPRIIRGTEFAT